MVILVVQYTLRSICKVIVFYICNNGPLAQPARLAQSRKNNRFSLSGESEENRSLEGHQPIAIQDAILKINVPVTMWHVGQYILVGTFCLKTSDCSELEIEDPTIIRGY